MIEEMNPISSKNNLQFTKIGEIREHFMTGPSSSRDDVSLPTAPNVPKAVPPPVPDRTRQVSLLLYDRTDSQLVFSLG